MRLNTISFMDILDDDDEISDSQPLSPISNESEFWGTSVVNKNSPHKIQPENSLRNNNPRNIEEIDLKYRNVFTHSNFNAVQAKVVDDALFSDKSMVVCAPTGSGKTVIFEMAIVQLLMERQQKNYTGDFKIIYMAPVKSLCNERLAEWHGKFTTLGLKCIEATGDHDLDFDQLRLYSLIITTPEKWDMLTRRWRDHRELVEVIKLFLIDEVHILNDQTRGPVLEAVVSRMKTIESSAQSDYRMKKAWKNQGIETTVGVPPKIRFVAVSATIGNPQDVAAWLGSKDAPAINHNFGEEYRPVKVNCLVEGYPCAIGTSIFKFDIILNYKLGRTIQKYNNGKPTLVFCNTRKGVILTAETLCRTLTTNLTPEQKSKLTALAATFKNKQLQNFISNGVGCHHAGLLYEERTNIERAFKDRELPILITTTTLAMGVNLPAHLVVIKNTKQYVNGAYEDYSISKILQMVGRAGRPQFDTEATAVIMTTIKDKPRYQALVGGSEPLQSYLHKRVAENLNSEIALGTVCDVAQCVQWLQSTFLYVRASADPRKYLGLPNTASAHHISNKITELCVKAKNALECAGLIKMDSACCIESTEAGRLMSLYYMDLETMKHIMKINGTETLEQLLEIVCESHELSDMHLRVDEKRILNTLNRSKATATIRFPITGKINTREKKLSCIIQAVLGCLPIHDPSLNQEAMKIMKIAQRVCKCLVAYVTRSDVISHQPQHFSAVLNSILLAKCITANLWENSVYLSKQLKGIGPTYSSLLAIAGKVKFALLEKSHPRDLERIMNKGPPAGNDIQKQISLLPKYQIQIEPLDDYKISLQIILLNHVYLFENTASWTAGYNHKAYIIVGDTNNNLLLFTSVNDRDLINFHGGSIAYPIKRKDIYEHKVFAYCISSNYVGLDVTGEYVFKSLQPGHYGATENNTCYKNNIKEATKNQFNNKRRNSDENIELSCEKKKRNNALMNRLMSLKRPLYSDSKYQTFNSQASVMMSKNILYNESFLENNISENDHINDSRYESLTTEETSKRNVDDITEDNERKYLQLTGRQTINEAPTQHFICNYKQKKFKYSRKKSNFDFIDLLEKNMDLDDSEDNSDGNKVLNDKKEEIVSNAVATNKYNRCEKYAPIQIQQNWGQICDQKIQSLEKNQSLNNLGEYRHINSMKNNEFSDIQNHLEGYQKIQVTKPNSSISYGNMKPIAATTRQDEHAFSYEELHNKNDELWRENLNVVNDKKSIVSQKLLQTKSNDNCMNCNELFDDEKFDNVLNAIDMKKVEEESCKNYNPTQMKLNWGQTVKSVTFSNEIKNIQQTYDKSTYFFIESLKKINSFNQIGESRYNNGDKNNNNESLDDEEIEKIMKATEKSFEKEECDVFNRKQIEKIPKAIAIVNEVEKIKQSTNYKLTHSNKCYKEFRGSGGGNDDENNNNESLNEETIENIMKATEKSFEKDNCEVFNPRQREQIPISNEIEKIKPNTYYNLTNFIKYFNKFSQDQGDNYDKNYNNESLNDEAIENIMKATEKSFKKEKCEVFIPRQKEEVPKTITDPTQVEKIKLTTNYNLNHSIKSFNQFNESRGNNDVKNNNDESLSDEKIESIMKFTEKGFEKENCRVFNLRQIEQIPKAIAKSKEINEENNNKNCDTTDQFSSNPFTDGKYVYTSKSTGCNKSRGIMEIDASSNKFTDIIHDREEEKNKDIVDLCDGDLDFITSMNEIDSKQSQALCVDLEKSVHKSLNNQNNECIHLNKYPQSNAMFPKVIGKSSNNLPYTLTDQSTIEKTLFHGSAMKNNASSACKFKGDEKREKNVQYDDSIEMHLLEPSRSKNNSAQYLTNKYEKPGIIGPIFHPQTENNKRSTFKGNYCDNNVESIKKYSYSDTSTRVTQNDDVCIIRKTKVDLGVTQIIKRIDIKKTNNKSDAHPQNDNKYVNEEKNNDATNIQKNETRDESMSENLYPIAKNGSTQVQREKINDIDSKQRNGGQRLFKHNFNSNKVTKGIVVESIPKCRTEETKINNNVQNNNPASLLLDTETESKLSRETKLINVLEKNRKIIRNLWKDRKETIGNIQTAPKPNKTSDKIINEHKMEPQMKQNIGHHINYGPEIALPKIFRSVEAHRTSNFTNERETFEKCEDSEENEIVNEHSNLEVAAIDASPVSVDSSVDEPDCNMFNQEDELKTDFQIDHAMFNPQTLLRINKSSENLISHTTPEYYSEMDFGFLPPPNNFIDLSEMLHCEIKIPADDQVQSEIDTDRNVRDRHLDLTPSRQIKPRVLSEQQNIDHNSTGYTTQNPVFDCSLLKAARRQAKLNQFRFVSKNNKKYKM